MVLMNCFARLGMTVMDGTMPFLMLVDLTTLHFPFDWNPLDFPMPLQLLMLKTYIVVVPDAMAQCPGHL